jgi:glutamate racemase
VGLSLKNSVNPIGVFDSGVGGLTVLRALRTRLPNEQFVYLGDTARLPYGTKSRESIERYALQAANLLIKQGVKCLVVACNTASAIALEVLAKRFAPLPVIGVVEPGAEAGCQASQSGRIAVIATESTVRGGAYEREIGRRRVDARVTTLACPLFVALAEEGWTSGPIVEAIAHRYLDGIFGVSALDRPDTLVLGCTHFPVLVDALSKVAGERVAIVDSALAAAAALDRELESGGLRRAHMPADGRMLRLLATDGPERFARVGGMFLGQPLKADDIELVDLGI